MMVVSVQILVGHIHDDCSCIQRQPVLLLKELRRICPAGGKRSGADYSAEATAVREMFEETAGAALPSLQSLQEGN